MATFNNLYPPIINTYMPAFAKNAVDGCRIYFSLSTYNSIDEVKCAQVIVNNQKTNQSELDSDIYLSQIKVTDVKEDYTKDTDDKYYIEVKKEDLVNKEFELNQYYKVQIRFSSAEAPTFVDGVQSIDNWLNENLTKFSEWSTVCLIKGIEPPQVNIKNFIEGETNGTVFSSSTVSLIGSVEFEENEQETLRSYRIKLYDSVNKLILDTNELYSNSYTNVNQINYTFKTDLKENEKYKIILNITTRNLYTAQYIYNFSISLDQNSKLNINSEISMDEENGRVKITLSGKNLQSNVVIRRTSDVSNFGVWEDVHIEPIDEVEEFERIWYDYTIESGVLYKYSIQKGYSNGSRGIAAILNEEPLLGVFNDMFLVSGNTQLKIKYNPSISSYKRTVSESKTDTIGSQYPFINKNGNVNYVELPISGLISFWMDEEEIFTSKEELFGGDYIDYYVKYNEERNINNYNDYLYEKKFREKVMDFLYDNNVKLFKSTTEGNFLVKLMNVSLSPEQGLNRYIYNFSCTAYEVADNTIENYNYYNIQSLGEYMADTDTQTGGSDGELEDTYENYSQVFYNGTTIFNAGTNIINLITEQEQNNLEEGYTAAIKNFQNIKFSFNSKPYLIKDNNGTPTIASASDSNTYLGYIIYIDKIPFVINEDGIYQISGDEIEINSITFAQQEDVNIYYKATVEVYSNASPAPSKNKATAIAVIYETIYPIQWTNIFTTLDSIVEMIKDNDTYNYDNDERYSSIINITRLEIEADPGTVLYIQSGEDTKPERTIIGPTGSLLIQENVYEFYFYGTFLRKSELDLNKFTTSDDVWKYDNKDITLYSFNSNGLLTRITNTASVNINSIEAIDLNIEELESTIEYGIEVQKGEK